MNYMPDRNDDESMCRISISTDSSDMEIDLEQLHSSRENSHRAEINTNLLTPTGGTSTDGTATYLKYENPWPNRRISNRSHDDADVLNTDEKLSLVKACKEATVDGTTDLMYMVLARPMEKEVFNEAKEEFAYQKNKEKCVNALKYVLKQDFYSNFHFIVLLNKNYPKVIEKCIFDQCGIKNFEEFDPKTNDSFDENKFEDFKVRLNVLKFILFFDKVGIEKQKDLVKKLTSLEKILQLRHVNDVKLKYWKALEAIWNKDLNGFIDGFHQYKKSIEEYYDDTSKSIKKCYSPGEFESLLTADCNLLILKDFSSDTKKIFRTIIKSQSVDIDRLIFSPSTPLIFFIAERGYYELLKILFDSKRDVKTSYKDENGRFVSLYNSCVEGFHRKHEFTKTVDLQIDHDRTLDLILKHITKQDEKSQLKKSKNEHTIARLLENFTFSINDIHNELFQGQNPMKTAMIHNYDNAALKLIQHFHLSTNMLKDMNCRVLEKFLNSCVSFPNEEILVNYEFLRSYEYAMDRSRNATEVIDHIVTDPDMSYLISHPVLSSYIENKCNRYSWWHYFDILTFVIFYVVCAVLGFLMTDETMKTVFLVVAASYIFVHSSYQLYYTEKTSLKKSESYTQNFHYIASVVYVIALPVLLEKKEKIWSVVLLALPALFVVLLFYQLFTHPDNRTSSLRFRRKLSYIIEFILFILTYTSIYYEVYSWKFCFSVILVLVTIHLIIQASLFPSCLANCIFMFEIAIKVVIKTLFVFSWIFVLYSIGFHTIFNGPAITNNNATSSPSNATNTSRIEFNSFENLWTSFVKVVTMLTGEYDAGFMHFTEWWNFGFFLVFILILLALYNMINAYTLISIQETRIHSEVNKLRRNWEIIKEYERFIEDGWGGLTNTITQFLQSESYIIHYAHFYCNQNSMTPNIPEGKNVTNIKVSPSKIEKFKQITKYHEKSQHLSDQEIRFQNVEKSIVQIHSITSQIKREVHSLTDKMGLKQQELASDLSKQYNDQTESKSLMQFGLDGLNRENEARKLQLDIIMQNLIKLDQQMALYHTLEPKLESLKLENDARRTQLDKTLQQLEKINQNLKLSKNRPHSA